MLSEVKLKITEDKPINPVWGIGSFDGKDSGIFLVIGDYYRDTLELRLKLTKLDAFEIWNVYGKLKKLPDGFPPRILVRGFVRNQFDD